MTSPHDEQQKSSVQDDDQKSSVIMNNKSFPTIDEHVLFSDSEHQSLS